LKLLALVPILCPLWLGSCNAPTEADILSGCYYDGDVAIIRLQGDVGTLLIPGDVANVQFVVQPSEDYFTMISRPGFILHNRDHPYAKRPPSIASPVFLADGEDALVGQMLIRTPSGTRRLAKRPCK